MSDRSGPIAGVLVLAVGVIFWIVSVGHSPTTHAAPTTTVKGGQQVTQTTDQASQLGASLGDWLRRLMGGDQPATPTTTTRKGGR